jgi:hypothetical protein
VNASSLSKRREGSEGFLRRFGLGAPLRRSPNETKAKEE